MGRLDYLYRMELPHRAISVYIYLMDRANKDGQCWPAIPTIALDLKLSQSTVRRALQDLRKVGLLKTEQITDEIKKALPCRQGGAIPIW